LRMRVYDTCELCGRRKNVKTQTEARRDAADARELMGQLLREYGSVRALAHAFAARHGIKPATAERKFYRLRAGQRALFDANFVDQLEVML
jgi:hypothetical protein